MSKSKAVKTGDVVSAVKVVMLRASDGGISITGLLLLSTIALTVITRYVEVLPTARDVSVFR